MTRDIAFATTDDDPGYAMTTTLTAVKRPDLGWPAYDELAFFPGLKNLVPWFDPFVFFDHQRLVFCQAVKDVRQHLASTANGAWP